MDEFEDWVGALSGKIAQITTEGVIELEGAGLQIFEKKKKEPKPDQQSTAAQSEDVGSWVVGWEKAVPKATAKAGRYSDSSIPWS